MAHDSSSETHAGYTAAVSNEGSASPPVPPAPPVVDDDPEAYLDDDEAFNGRNQQQQTGAIVPPTRCNQARIDELLKRTGFAIVQENGQRKYAPSTPESLANLKRVDQAPPDRGCEVFVGKIPRDCFEDELIPVLERAGLIYEFRLMMEYSGMNRGYGFVMYTSREDAKKAVRELNNYEIRKGRMIGLCRSVDNCRLFVGGIPKNKKREEILDEMRKITDEVVNVIVYPSAHDKSKNRGFAFVQYSCHRAAAVARRKLIPARIQLFGQPIAVDWAEPEPEVDEDVMATVKVLYVRNLMLHTAEETIKREFEKIKENSIERVKKMKDFAFVHFREREDALNAMKIMNGASIDGSVVEVTLSKPVDKTNLARLTRGNTPSPTNPILVAGLNPAFAQDLTYLLNANAALAKLPQLMSAYPATATAAGGLSFNDPNLVYPGSFQQFGGQGAGLLPVLSQQQQQQLAASLAGGAPQLQFQPLNTHPHHQAYLQSAYHLQTPAPGATFQFGASDALTQAAFSSFPQSTYPPAYIANYQPQQQQQHQTPVYAGAQQPTTSSTTQQQLQKLSSAQFAAANSNNSRVLRANLGSRMPNVTTAAMGVYGRSGYALHRGNTSSSSSSSIGGPSVKKQATSEDVIFDMYSGLKPVPLLPLGAQAVLNPPLAGMSGGGGGQVAASASAKTSVQLLEEICGKEGLPQPSYMLQTSAGKEQDGRDVTWFSCKILIPGLFNNESLGTNQVLRSAEEAKNNAADLVLSQFYMPAQQQQQQVASASELNEFYNIQQQQLKSASELSKLNAAAAAAAAAANAQYIIDPNGAYIFCSQPQ